MALQKVLGLVGPTASGKSDLAVQLAKRLNGEIISADSRQVYKGLDIGTGKITKIEMRGIPHHLLDVADPKKQFSVADFLVCTNKTIVEIVHRNKIPIIVGGTGFYIDALAGKVSLPNVPSNKKLRERLSKKSNAELFKLLRKKDPRRARDIDFNNKVRLIRALEIVEALGKVPYSKRPRSKYKFIYIGLKPDNLDRRIETRLTKRLDGMIKEGRKLKARGLTYKRMSELGLEYRYVALFLQGKISKAEMFERLNIAIRQYAKRQMTWFKRNKKIRWFKPNEYRKILKEIKASL